MRAAPEAEPGAFITDGVPRLHGPRDPDSGSDRFHFKPEEVILKIVQSTARWTLLGFLVLGCQSTPATVASAPAILPVPDFLSPQARLILSQPVDRSRALAPAPRTAEEWHARRKAAEDAFMRPRYDRMLAATGVRVEKKALENVVVRELTPPAPRKPFPGIVLINLHGGGYTIGGGDISASEGLPLAAAGYRVISVDYRMPPEHPYPAAVEDGVAVYRALLEDYAPEHIAIFGTSAGGGLTASVIVAARDQGLPIPAAAIMHTPWSDLSKTGDTYYTLDGIDPVLTTYDGSLAQGALLYAGETDLKNPLISPVYASFEPGFPPSLLSSGTRDLLLSCTVRLHRALREAGVPADLHVFDAMWHGAAMMPDMQDLNREVLKFIAEHVGPAGSDPSLTHLEGGE